MTQDSELQKVFVHPDDQTTIVCPDCNSARTLSVQQFRHRQHLLKVKCKCGHIFKAMLEFRQKYRKKTDLDGNYSLDPKSGTNQVVKVVNLSLSGACFETRGIPNLQIGQKGTLIFTLDNRKQTVIQKQVIVRTINNRRVGCEFIADRAFETDLGFYIRP